MLARVVVVLLAALVLAVAATELQCPVVLDGLTPMGTFDLQEQQATGVIGGHWSGLDDKDVLAYEYAVVSSKQLAPDFGAVCRKTSGFYGVPEVIDWTFTRKQTAFANSNVQLSVGTQYFVVVRTILHNGTQVYSNSNGVRVVPPHPTMHEEPSQLKLQLDGSPKRVARDTLLTPLDAVNLFCPIDAANRCRQSTKAPGAILNEIYGPPVFNTDSQTTSLFLIPTTAQDALAIGADPLNSRAALLARGLPGNQLPQVVHSSDDDEFEAVLPGVAIAGIVVPITVGTMVLMAILALLAWLLASSGGRDYREDRTRVASVAPAAGGATAPAATPPPNDTVRMDFPDLDVRS